VTHRIKLDAKHRTGPRSRLARTSAALTMAWAILAPAATAGDWPQILGPLRNGQAQDEKLSSAWPADGPRLLWKMDVGHGYAGVAVSADRVVLFHRRGDQLLGETLDAATGKPLWKVAFATKYASSIAADDGPRCVPLIHAGQVFLLGPKGELQCVELATGKTLWFRNLYTDFKAPDGYFGAGSSPIIEGDKLLINVGGAPGAGLVALSPADGQTLWKSTDEAASYSSPVAATVDGVRHVIFVTRLNVLSVDPRTGAVRFRFPFGARGPTVNAANPLVLDDHLFVSASYGVGAQWAKIDARQATEVWASDTVMSSQYATCVEAGGMLYGIDGRQDVGVARLRCFDPRDGKIRWTEERFGMATLMKADGKLLIMKIDGQLILAEPSAEEFKPLARGQLFGDTVQALPALANGRFLARDTGTLKAFALGAAQK
jgi:outer membrane protein assembly factor BamB